MLCCVLTLCLCLQEWVEVGVVGPPHGLDGSVKIKPLTDFPQERLGTPGIR